MCKIANTWWREIHLLNSINIIIETYIYSNIQFGNFGGKLYLLNAFEINTFNVIYNNLQFGNHEGQVGV